MICPEGTSVTACRLGEAHCHSSLPSPSLLVLNQGGREVGAHSELDGPRCREKPSVVTLFQAADMVTSRQELKPLPTSARKIPAGSHPMGVVQKRVKMPGSKCQAPRRAMLLYQMSALLSIQAWSFPQLLTPMWT